MKNRFRKLFVFLVLSMLIVNGCYFGHHASFEITQPANNQTFPTTAHITVNLHRYASVSPYNNIEYEMMDNGRGFAQHVVGGNTVEVQEPLPMVVVVVGPHTIQARARGFNNATDHSNWYETSICIYIGPNPPGTFTCLQYGWPAALEIAPTEQKLIIFPTSTPLDIIQPPANLHPGGNNNPGGKNPGGSSPSCPAGETYTCDPVCGCAPG